MDKTTMLAGLVGHDVAVRCERLAVEAGLELDELVTKAIGRYGEEAGVDLFAPTEAQSDFAQNTRRPLARWLAVVLSRDDHVEVRHGTTQVFGKDLRSEQLICFPPDVGIYLEPDGPRYVVAGYQVLASDQMPWDTVPPRCVRCGKPFQHGDDVILTPYAELTEPGQYALATVIGERVGASHEICNGVVSPVGNLE